MYLMRFESDPMYSASPEKTVVSSGGFVHSGWTHDMDLSGDLHPGVTLNKPLFVLRHERLMAQLLLEKHPVEVALCFTAVL